MKDPRAAIWWFFRKRFPLNKRLPWYMVALRYALYPIMTTVWAAREGSSGWLGYRADCDTFVVNGIEISPRDLERLRYLPDGAPFVAWVSEGKLKIVHPGDWRR